MFRCIGCNRFLMKIKDFAFMTGSACQSQDAFIGICRNSVSMKIQFAGHLGGRCGFRHFAIGFAKVILSPCSQG